MSNVDGLWRRYKSQNDSQAREQLILEYAHLTKYVVGRLNVRPSAVVSYDDMLGYAVIGLIDAVEKFDLGKAVKFETYAVTRIRGAVLDALKSLDWVPRSVRSSAQELKRTMAALEARLGRPVADEEIADEMGVGIDELNDLLSNTGQSAMLSLEELMVYGEDYSTDRGLGTSSDLSFDPMFSAEADERKRILASAIGELPEREKLVVSLYYKEGLTLKEIAQVLGVTESRTCQIHSKAVTRLNGKLTRHADLMLAVA